MSRIKIMELAHGQRPSHAKVAAMLGKVLPGLQNNSRQKIAFLMLHTRRGEVDGLEGGGLAWRWDQTILSVDRDGGPTDGGA